MTLTYKIGLIFAGFILAGALFVSSYQAFGALSPTSSTPQVNPVGSINYFTFFAGTTTTAVSTNQYEQTKGMDITGAKKVTLFFTRGGATGPNVGKTIFDIDVSPNGTTWHDYSRLLGTDVSETATSTVTINAGTSTTVVSVDLDNFAAKYIRCNATETTDGDHTCRGLAQY